jgi:Zn-dependent peptidase ImmA (M78 family)
VPDAVAGCRPDEVVDNDDAPGGTAGREAEANAFARELLMPEPLLTAAVAADGPNLPALAAGFDVSVPALRLRLVTLSLLPPWMASTPVVR